MQVINIILSFHESIATYTTSLKLNITFNSHIISVTIIYFVHKIMMCPMQVSVKEHNIKEAYIVAAPVSSLINWHGLNIS